MAAGYNIQMADFGDFDIEINDNVKDEVRAEKGKPNSFDSREPKNFSSQGSYPSGQNEQGLSIGASDYNLSNAAHPYACIATVLFKGLAMFFYLFVGLFMPDVLTFITVMILSALDFWTVKNVTGRLLVGLRWWSDYDEKGEEVWKFESFDKLFKSNPVDKTFFWTGQLSITVAWAVFLFIKILSLSPFWALLDLINFALSGTNLYGYYKCRGDYNKKLKSLKNEGLKHLAGRIFK